MLKYIASFVILFSLVSCNNDKPAPKAKPQPIQKAAPAVASKPGYPRIPNELLLKMWNEGQMIDYLFHDLPFSMNQNEIASIRTNMTYISEKPLDKIPTKCKPIARQFYQVGGEIVFEGDIYFSEGCQFYVFLVDGKPMYGNYMSEAGIQFFNNMIAQAMQARQNMGQGG